MPKEKFKTTRKRHMVSQSYADRCPQTFSNKLRNASCSELGLLLLSSATCWSSNLEDEKSDLFGIGMEMGLLLFRR